MNYNEAVKKQQNKTAILEKLMESIMIREVDCKDIENLSSSVKSPNDAAELISKIERVLLRVEKQYFSIGLSVEVQGK